MNFRNKKFKTNTNLLHRHIWIHFPGLLSHMEHMRMEQKHQFAAQYVLSRAAAERRERELLASQAAMLGKFSRQNSIFICIPYLVIIIMVRLMKERRMLVDSMVRPSVYPSTKMITKRSSTNETPLLKSTYEKSLFWRIKTPDRSAGIVHLTQAHANSFHKSLNKFLIEYFYFQDYLHLRL